MCEVDNPHHAEYHRQPDTYEHQVGDAIDDLQRKSCKKIHCWIPCRLSTRDRFNRFQPPLTRFQNKTLTDGLCNQITNQLGICRLLLLVSLDNIEFLIFQFSQIDILDRMVGLGIN